MPNSEQIDLLAREVADAWLAHVCTPGRGTVERYSAAKEALVKLFYPDSYPLKGQGWSPAKEEIRRRYLEGRGAYDSINWPRAESDYEMTR